MIKLDLDFIFDGNKPWPEFVQAVQLVNSKKYPVDTKLRASVVDPGVFSDFFAGQGRAPGGLGLEGLIGAFGEPSAKAAAARGYVNEKSAPDAELSYEDMVAAFGKDVADRALAAVTGIGVEGLGGPGGNVTFELKQKIGLSDTQITLTGRNLSAGESYDAETLQKALKNIKQSKTANIIDWFYNQASPKYRNDVLKIIDQKIANYVSFVYIDRKSSQAIGPKAFIVTDAAKKLNLKDPSRGQQFLAPELRSDGTLSFRLNKAGEKFLESQQEEVVSTFFTRLSNNFADKLLRYYFTDPKQLIQRSITKIPKLSKYVSDSKGRTSLVAAFAELIMFAAQFDPAYGGIPFEIETDIRSAAGFGAIKSKSRGRPSTKRKLRDPVQQQISLLQIQQLAKRLIRQAMPTGIDRFNPPPRPDILTYRTGRLFDSIKLTQWSQKTNIIKYTYDPIYEVYQDEARSVDALVQEKGLRPAIQQLFGQKYFRFQRVGVKR